MKIPKKGLNKHTLMKAGSEDEVRSILNDEYETPRRLKRCRDGEGRYVFRLSNSRNEILVKSYAFNTSEQRDEAMTQFIKGTRAAKLFRKEDEEDDGPNWPRWEELSIGDWLDEDIEGVSDDDDEDW